jgi:hypothetical protein
MYVFALEKRIDKKRKDRRKNLRVDRRDKVFAIKAGT